jgi:ferredoxin-nitrate reductase
MNLPRIPWRAWDGPLTTDLARVPGGFGLGQVPARLKPDATTGIVCGYCATGCGLTAHLVNGEAVNLSPDPRFPVNQGMACPKGWEALAALDAPDRATTPLLRNPATGAMEPVGWSQALHAFVSRMKSVQQNWGPQSIAFLSTGQICTEEMALLGALFKFGMRGLHCDSNTRQCMATAHVAYKQSLGFDAPPYTYADFEESDCLVFVGSNPAVAHPILWQRVLQNRRSPEIIVLDPRRTETAMGATLHVPLAPKSDLVLLYGVASALIRRGAVDRAFIEAHTRGFEAFAAAVSGFTPEQVCAEAKIPLDLFETLVERIATRPRVSYWWTMGVNQGHESTRTAQAIINLALMTGQIGKPGTGANSITGQCNAMGSRLFSNVTNLFGGRDFADPAARLEVESLLGLPAGTVPSENSWAYDRIVDGIESGAIRGLWIIATNSSHSWIQQRRFNELLGRLEFLVVQDLYTTTETAQRADLLLPAAGWGEKEGTFINSERRLGLVKRVRRPPGQALSDFHIFRLIAEAWGCADLFADWQTPEAVFGLLKRLSRGRPCDITGIDGYRAIDALGGIQWPFSQAMRDHVLDPVSDASLATLPETRAAGIRERRLFADGCFPTSDGRAVFHHSPPTPVPEPTDPEYPWILLTGRGTSSQWHTNTRTSKSPVLRQLYPETCYVEIHPDDAARLALHEKGRIRVRSRRAELVADAWVTPAVQPGQVFIPMHYRELNPLTLTVVDPHSRQPSYKFCAVALEALPPA